MGATRGSECRSTEVLLSLGSLPDSADDGREPKSSSGPRRPGRSAHMRPFPLGSGHRPASHLHGAFSLAGVPCDRHFYVTSIHTCLFLNPFCNSSREQRFSSITTVFLFFFFRVAFVMKKHLNTHLLGKHGVGTPKER